MKSFGLAVISFVIVICSMWVSTGEINYYESGTDAISSLPQLVASDVTGPSKKELVHAALMPGLSDASIALAKLFKNEPYAFYVPIFSLYRINQFFLII